MNPDELRAPETDDEPWDPRKFGDPEGTVARWEVYTVAILAGLTLAAIAWRFLR